jgi:hypothetical protein
VQNENRFLSNVPLWLYPAIPVAATFIVWFGSTRSGFTPDDYLAIDWQSPIRSMLDVVSMFWRRDPNLLYWRPLTNASVSLDFLLYGWNGGMFHLTNLLLHLAAVIILYIFARRIFFFSPVSACMLALIFGVSGSHDSNLLWISARSDVIATITMLLTLLTAFKALQHTRRSWLWLGSSYLLFFLSLSSKESCIMTIFLLPILIYSSSPKELWEQKKRIIRMLIPYIGIAVVYFAIRSQYTLPLSQVEAMNSQGSFSVATFVRNGLYTIGYAIVPIDFHTASIVIGNYAVEGFVTAAVLFIGAITLLITSDRRELRKMYKPFLFALITGIISFQAFERWRIYSPSIGILAMLIIVYQLLWNKGTFRTVLRTILILLTICFVTFHIRKSLSAQYAWAKATSQIAVFESDFHRILEHHPERPITLELLASPAKLGDAPLLQLLPKFVAIKADAEIRNFPSREFGTIRIPGDTIDVTKDIDVFAYDPDTGFTGYSFKHIGSGEFDISGNEQQIGLFPNMNLFNKSRRDAALHPGVHYRTYPGSDVEVLSTESSFASHLTLRNYDTASVALYFDGSHIKELERYGK